MDKQKEIEKMACDICLLHHCCNDPNNPIDSCKPLRMAKRAVAAGYGDVRAAVKETAQDIFSWIYKNLVNMNFVTGNVEINLPSLDTFAKTYGVEIFDIFKQGVKQ